MNTGSRLKLGARILGGILSPDSPSTVVVHVTQDCNAQCSFCSSASIRRPPSSADRSPHLSIEEYARFARSLRPLYQVILGGGEPFLRHDLVDIVEAFCIESDARLISIATNGSLHDRIPATVERMVTRCPDAAFNVQVSLDAVGDRHDALRGLAGCFRSAIRVCHELIGLGRQHPNLTLVIGTVANEETVSHLPDLRAFLALEFGDLLPFHSVQFDQRLQRLPVALLDSADARCPLAQEGGPGRLRRFIEKYYVDFVNDIVLRQIREDRMIYRCNAGSKLCVVLPVGGIAPCEPFAFEPCYHDFLRLNIRDHDCDFRKVLKAPGFQPTLRFIKDGRCTACSWSCAAISSLMFSPSNWPLLLNSRGIDRWAAR